METTRKERIRLGLFILICGGGAIAFVIYIVGLKLSQREDVYYTIFSESVIGLSVDAKVKLNGIDVGHVTNITIDTNDLQNVVVHFGVMPGTPIKQGTRATMTSGISLTGAKHIVLTGGAINEPNVPKGGHVQAGKTFINQLSGQAENFIIKIEMLLNNVNNLISEENTKSISNSLKNIELATANLRDLGKEAKQPMEDLGDAATSLKTVLTEVEATHPALELKTTLERIQEMLAGIDTKTLNDELASTLSSVNSLAKRTDLLIYKNQDQINESLASLQQVLENFEDFSQKIKDQPSALIIKEKKNRRK